MIQKDKRRVIIDFYARLPYGIRVRTPDVNNACVLGIVKRSSLVSNIIYTEVITNVGNYKIEDVKEYLRPMSSMTKEEKHDYFMTYTSVNGIDIPHPYKTQDWCNANHFDYRGLIPKGLALVAPEGMYN